MLLKIIILFLLIIINGIFSASELAFLSVDKLKLKQNVKEKNKKAIKIKGLIDNPSSFLATIQIVITFAGFLASAFAAETFADQIVQYLSFVPIAASLLKTIVLVVVTLILSYFTLVLGELVPKKIALTYPEKIAYAMVDPITVIMKMVYPFVWLLTKSTNLIARIFHIHEKANEDKMTEEKIKAIIATGKEEGAIEAGEKELIFNIFQFNDIEAKDIMTSREYMVAVDSLIDKRDLINVIKRCKFTRIPVYEKKLNHIVGILNVKDMIIKYSKNYIFNLKNIIHEPFFVDQHDKVDDIFRSMQKQRQSMAIVQDSQKNTVGLLTLEDAIEEIVGNIFDEYDEEK